MNLKLFICILVLTCIYANHCDYPKCKTCDKNGSCTSCKENYYYWSHACYRCPKFIEDDSKSRYPCTEELMNDSNAPQRCAIKRDCTGLPVCSSYNSDYM